VYNKHAGSSSRTGCWEPVDQMPVLLQNVCIVGCIRPKMHNNEPVEAVCVPAQAAAIVPWRGLLPDPWAVETDPHQNYLSK
jgi:hypothetical protein